MISDVVEAKALGNKEDKSKANIAGDDLPPIVAPAGIEPATQGL